MGKTSKDKRDIYYRLAKEQGWRARSAFKLLQIQETFDIFQGAKNVVDLCAAPGSWSQVLSRNLYEPASDHERNEIRIIAVDLQTMNPIEGVMQLKGDITCIETSDRIIEYFDGELADLVVCDGAPDVIGLLDTDEYIQHELVIAALEISIRILKPGGTLLAKVFRGKRILDLLSKLVIFSGKLTIVKPKCSRDSSLEAFVLCQEFCVPADIHNFDNLRGYFGQKMASDINQTCPGISVPFVACGKSDAFDSDRTYSLTFDGKTYEHRLPVQPPIHPPYEKAQKMRKDRTLARIEKIEAE